MVVELTNRIPRRQPLDAPLFRHDALVARYDERSGVRGHGTPKRCIYPPIITPGLRSAVFDTPRGGRHAFQRLTLLSGRHRPANLRPPRYRGPTPDFGRHRPPVRRRRSSLAVSLQRTLRPLPTIDDLDDLLQSTNSVLAKQNMTMPTAFSL